MELFNIAKKNIKKNYSSSDGRVETMSRVVGIYALLGYRKSTMIRLFSFENFLICISALGIGIVLGAFIHKFKVAGIVYLLNLQIDTSEIPIINLRAVLLSFILY